MKSDEVKNLDETVDGIFRAVVEHNQSSLEKVSIDLDILLTEFESFPHSVLMSVLNILRNPRFRKMQGSYFLLGNIFKGNLEMLSDEQKGELFNVLKEIYRELEDSTTCMVALEIMVDLFRDERSLNVLRDLKAVDAEMPRAMACYGLYYFIREIRDNEQKERALNELEKMKHDPSEIVQKELSEALSKLGAKGAWS